MIALDENLVSLRAEKYITKWYPGRVCYITDLRRKSVIKDEAVPALLLRVKGVTFVTTNVTDFWKKVPAHPRYCIICLSLPNERLYELPALLKQIFHLPLFKTKNSRAGKIARANRFQIEYYTFGRNQIHALAW